MPVRVIHLIDRNTPEDALRLLQLLARAQDRIKHTVALLGPAAPLEFAPGTLVTRVPLRAEWPLLSLPAMRRLVSRDQPDVLHVLGSRAVGVAGGLRKAGVSIPVVATLTDPAEAAQMGRWWGALGEGRVELLCASSMMQRRLVERGIPIEQTAVVRPGVDFAEIRRARERAAQTAHSVFGTTCASGRSPAASGHLEALNRSSTAGSRAARPDTPGEPPARPRGPVLVMPSPPTRAGGQFAGVWAVAILHQIWPEVRLLIPGRSREADRIGRLIRQIYCPQAFVMTAERYTPAELLSISDALVVPALEDVSAGWIAWAMAAGVPVIGSAIPAVTEFIADRHNGFLCRAGEPHTLAIRIRIALEAPGQVRQCVEVARGQAYDVFRAQQCMDHYTRAFTTLASGRPALGAVQDAARDA